MIEVSNDSGIEVSDLDEFSALARYVLAEMRVDPRSELSVTLVDVTTMTELHVRWLDEPGPTDVMSFPMDELRPGTAAALSGPGMLGDVVLCPEVAARQAKVAGHSALEEMLLLTAHSILHLLGYDHATPDEEAEMFALQRNLLLNYLGSR
ncbi:MAG: rRNA maturation RNase YbeY [Promicromonosporaceae bacterium]|nr:rRNA maturation RNase YbeY [Promicromonosporaceae bacterium]